MRFFTHAQGGNGPIDFNQIWHINSLGGEAATIELVTR